MKISTRHLDGEASNKPCASEMIMNDKVLSD